MSDLDVTAAISDRQRDLRIIGQIIPPAGTTVGNVLTATATGSSWQAGGGGTTSGAVNRAPPTDITIADGFSLVVVDYYTPSGALTLQGDAVVRIIG